MNFTDIARKIKNIALLLVYAFLAFTLFSIATEESINSDAFTTGIENTIAVGSQAYDQYLDVKAAEEERQRLADLGYPEGYDPDDPVGMGEVDPWEAYNDMRAEEMDRAMAEEAMRAWEEQYTPQPDISDGIIKP